MQKIILFLSVWALVPAVYVAVARADDDAVLGESRGVAQRMNCGDIKREMDGLMALDALSDSDLSRLNVLQADYRSKCMKKSGRRSVGRPNVVVTPMVDVQEVMVADASEKVDSTCDVPDANGCCPGETYKDLGDLGFNCCTENDEHCFPPMQVDAADAGEKLCEDGSAPNADGCCAGEVYTDLGELGFNCCLSDGVTCFPPMK